MKRMTVLAALAGLTACADGQSSTSISIGNQSVSMGHQSVGGVWRGEMMTASGTKVAGLMLVTEDGRFFSEAENPADHCADVAQGLLTGSGTQLGGQGNIARIDYTVDIGVQNDCAYTDGAVWGSETLSGSVSPRSTLSMESQSATSFGTALPSATSTLTYDALYEETSSLSKVAGTWTLAYPNNVKSAIPIINDPTGFASTTGLSLLGGAALSGTALQLTSGINWQARAVWYATPVNVQSFTTDFDFQLTAALADGFTFTLQNAGVTAVGMNGGGLAYEGIGSSVAVKFDLYDNSGEGPDSTGFYTNGAAPTVPAVDMTASGVNLHSGDILHAHLAYDGTTLTLTLTDTVTSANFTTSAALNIPATVGANTAYVGFTAGTGGLSAIQSILNWTYVTGVTTPAPAISIGTDGVIAAHDAVNGCTLDGQVSIINANYNAYAVTVTYTNCGNSASAFDGLNANGLMTRDDTVTPTVLRFVYSMTLANGQVLILPFQASN